jgi:hypothetical protein
MMRWRSAAGRLAQRLISAMVRQQPTQYAPSSVQIPTQGEAMAGAGRSFMIAAVYAPDTTPQSRTAP